MPPKKKKTKLSKELQSLREEMELVHFNTTNQGHARRKVSKQQLTERLGKWRNLERKDHESLLEDADETERIRGSAKALDSAVVQGSLVFNETNDGQEVGDDEGDAEFSESDPEKLDEKDEGDRKLKAASGPAHSSGTTTRASTRRRKKLHRLRNFKSYRLAESHGEALAAHARGDHASAIAKLNEIAKQVPSAPQIYSSLGLVYEDMLDQNEKNNEKPTKEAFDLATKAYGAYHAAACLCRRDYTLWCRSADLASRLVAMHKLASLDAGIPIAAREFHASEAKRIIESDVKGNFLKADKLKPQGVDVPAKLAQAHMETGHLSDALTILTDLKNRRNEDGSPTEFEKNYEMWLLYSDLMLQIGNACRLFLKKEAQSYPLMFRRWLKQNANEYDWSTIRLHSLVKALEAAVGSRSCEKLIQRISPGLQPEVEPRRTFELPMVGSFRTVFNIANLILLHCISFKFFEEGCMAAEAVSDYVKRRSYQLERHDRMRARFKTFQEESTSIFALRYETYDADVGDHSDSESEDAFSDNELFEDENPQRIQEFRMGCLPADLMVLYGVSLLGRGGRKFLAQKALSFARHLGGIEPSFFEPLSEDGRLQSFYNHFRSTISQPSAMALVFDTIQSLKELSSSDIKDGLGDIFMELSSDLRGWLREEGREKNTMDPFKESSLTTSIKICLMAAEMTVDAFDARIGSDIREIEPLVEGASLAGDILERFNETEGSDVLTAISNAALSLMLLSVQKLSMLGQSQLFQASKEKIIPLIFRIMKSLGLDPPPKFTPTKEYFECVRDFPFDFYWLSAPTGSIALRVAELCVDTPGTNHDSPGMEDGNSFMICGAPSEGGYGCFPDHIEEMLTTIWEHLDREVDHDCIGDNILSSFRGLKDVQWYKKRKLSTEFNGTVVSQGKYLTLMNAIGIANLCYSLVCMEDTPRELGLYTLSIIMPLTKYCMNRPLWLPEPTLRNLEHLRQSGTQVITPVPRNQQKNPVHPRQATFEVIRSDSSSRTDDKIMKRKKTTRKIQTDVFAWIESENKNSPCLNSFELPLFLLQREWDNVAMVSTVHGISSLLEKSRMVDTCISQLRTCSTEDAAERACLRASSALIDLASSEECQSFLICLRHAVLLASQGPKAGNDKDVFRAPLPITRNCKARDALIGLCRAECFVAMNCPAEAVYICSYVAGVCRDRRAKGDWNRRWDIVSAHWYNAVVSVRYLLFEVIRNLDNIDESTKMLWKNHVLPEIGSMREQTKVFLSLIDQPDTESSEMLPLTGPPLFGELPFDSTAQVHQIIGVGGVDGYADRTATPDIYEV